MARERAGIRAKLSAALRVPPDVRAVLDGAPGERLLSWGRDRGGSPLVATDRGMWAYGDRLAWLEIDHVRWADHVLSITAIDGHTRDVGVGEDRDLPAVIRAQVDGSIVATRPVPLLPDGRGATIMARRSAGSDLQWRIRYDAGVPSDDQALHSRVDEALAAMREELGI